MPWQCHVSESYSRICNTVLHIPSVSTFLSCGTAADSYLSQKCPNSALNLHRQKLYWPISPWEKDCCEKSETRGRLVCSFPRFVHDKDRNFGHRFINNSYECFIWNLPRFLPFIYSSIGANLIEFSLICNLQALFMPSVIRGTSTEFQLDWIGIEHITIILEDQMVNAL
jgi:hypothetical protein